MTSLVIGSLSFLTLTSNILLTLFLLLWLSARFWKPAAGIFDKIKRYLVKRSLYFAFIVALTATSGSLYFSEGAGFEPCKLCWFQRIFMYPQLILLGTAIIKKAKDVTKYILPLSTIGGFIALYHYIMQISPDPLAPCSTIGFSVSCSERFFTYFGYITIPWMAFSAFLLISLFVLQANKAKNEG